MSAMVEVPNPFNNTALVPLGQIPTPLAFLNPSTAHNINLATYIHIASTGILIWDVLNNLRNDLRMITNCRKLCITMLLYFVMRITLLAYSIGRTFLLTAEIDNCGALQNALMVLLIISLICVKTFFYLRVVAVYSRNLYIVGFFGVTWLSAIAMSSTFYKTYGAVYIKPTQYCREVVNGNLLMGALGVLLANDSLIYIAIACRIYRIFRDYDFESTWKRKAVMLLFGASLPVGSKVVILESQLYCMLIVISKVFLVIMVATNQARNSMFVICHLVLLVILVSRVYRELREIGNTSQRAPVTDFRTEGLTSAEFVRAGRTEQEMGKNAEIEKDVASLAGSSTRTASLSASIRTYASDRSDFRLHSLRSGEGETSQQSSFFRSDMRSDKFSKV